MHYHRLALLLCALWSISSCGPEDFTAPIVQSSDLVGHWDVTTFPGLMFVEFTPDNRLLIQDKGAFAHRDTAIYYFQDYVIAEDRTIKGLPSNSTISDIKVNGDELSFVLENPTNGHHLTYYGKRKAPIAKNENTKLLNKTWITVEEDGLNLPAAAQKVSYFSDTGLFMLKDLSEDETSLFSWEWIGNYQICYTEYQRPRLLQKSVCMYFVSFSEEAVEFIADGSLIKMEPTLLF